MEFEPFDIDEDGEVIMSPYDLGDYSDCLTFSGYLEEAIEDTNLYEKLFISIHGQKKDLNSVTLGLGVVDEDNLSKYLSHLLDDPDTLSATFDETVNGGSVVTSSQKYFVVLNSDKNILRLPHPEDYYIPIPKGDFLAFATPVLKIAQSGDKSLEWQISSVDDVDLSDKGAESIRHIKQYMVQKTDLKPSSKKHAAE